MKPNEFHSFTFFDWSENDRPEVQIHPACEISGKWSAVLEVGGNHIISIDDDKASLKEQLEGYADIFRAAAESL